MGLDDGAYAKQVASDDGTAPSHILHPAEAATQLALGDGIYENRRVFVMMPLGNRWVLKRVAMLLFLPAPGHGPVLAEASMNALLLLALTLVLVLFPLVSGLDPALMLALANDVSPWLHGLHDDAPWEQEGLNNGSHIKQLGPDDGTAPGYALVLYGASAQLALGDSVDENRWVFMILPAGNRWVLIKVPIKRLGLHNDAPREQVGPDNGVLAPVPRYPQPRTHPCWALLLLALAHVLVFFPLPRVLTLPSHFPFPMMSAPCCTP